MLLKIEVSAQALGRTLPYLRENSERKEWPAPPVPLDREKPILPETPVPLDLKKCLLPAPHVRPDQEN